jgi:hypothetical protein
MVIKLFLAARSGNHADVVRLLSALPEDSLHSALSFKSDGDSAFLAACR